MDEDVNLPEENNSPTVFDLIKNLLSPSTLPHVILLGIAGIGLYLLSSSVSDWLFAIGISGYIALSIGYALTAWMQEMKIIYRFSHIQPIPKSTSFIEKILLYVIRIMMSWIAPLMLSTIPFIILASYLTSDTGSDQVIYWAMSLASLFIIWSWAQGKAMASSLRIVVEARAMRLAKTPRDSKRFTSTTVHMFTIGIFAAFTYWLTISGGKNTGDMSLIEKLGPLIFAVCAIIVQGFLFWRTTERRKIDSERKDTAVFGFTWGLLIQLFVTWHLLSAYRRFTSDNWGVMLIVEELILMVVTVIAAIWSLAKDTHERGFRLFTQNNAIFWGLSFGFAYAGSIAMIAVLGSKITDDLPGFGDVGLAASIGIGHLITALTMMWIHAWRIGGLARWIDATNIVSEGDLEEGFSEESSIDSEDSGHDDDWGEAGWKDPANIQDDSTSSIPGTDVEWDNKNTIQNETDDDEVELVELD